MSHKRCIDVVLCCCLVKKFQPMDGRGKWSKSQKRWLMERTCLWTSNRNFSRLEGAKNHKTNMIPSSFRHEGLERPSSWQKNTCEMREEGRCTLTDSAVLFLQEGDIGRKQNKTQQHSIGWLVWTFGSVWAIVNSKRTRYYPSPRGTNMITWGGNILYFSK